MWKFVGASEASVLYIYRFVKFSTFTKKLIDFLP